MKRNKLIKAYSLIEIVLALLILVAAVLPIIGTISNDTKNALIIANNEYAMQKARYILDTVLDSVNFDELNSGSPAQLTGNSLKNLFSSLFPESGNTGNCEGTITDTKGQKFYVKLDVYDLKDLTYSAYDVDSVQFIETFATSSVRLDCEDQEVKKGNPSYPKFSFYTDVLYTNPIELASTTSDFYKDENHTTLIKALILNIRWNDSVKNNPNAEGFREFKIATNKARLMK
ncbi:MAG: hypothetical protein IKO19_07830 [Candidatus Riflebacteria bacterium]|nr:hypothetical protein [Candidatus Riflebacteria bacterium]